MKTLKITLTALLASVTCISWGQTFVHVEELAETSPGEYTVVITTDDLPLGAITGRWCATSDSMDLVNSGDTLYGYRPAAPYYETIISYFNSKMIASARLNPPSVRADMVLNSYVLPSSKVNSDGEIVITFDRPVPPASFSVWNLNNGIEYAKATTDDETYTISDMHVGLYIFDIYPEALDSSVHMIQFSGFLGQPADLPNDHLMLSITGQSAFDSCNGTMEITPFQAVGDVTYSWDDELNIPDTNLLSGLCPGFHRGLATDEDGNNVFINLSVDGFSTSNFGFQAGTIPATDTIFETVYNCDFDYEAAVDSIHYIVTDNGTSDQYQYIGLTYVIYQGTDSTLIYTGSWRDTTMGGFPYSAVQILCMTDPVVFYATRSAIPGMDMPAIRQKTTGDAVLIYPNPVTSRLLIPSGRGSGTILDLSGNELIRFSNGSADVEGLLSGIYFVRVDGDMTLYRIVKL